MSDNFLQFGLMTLLCLGPPRTSSNLLGIKIEHWNAYALNNASIHLDNSSEHSIQGTELRLLQDQLLSFSLCQRDWAISEADC